MVPSVSKEKSIYCGAFFWLDDFYEVLILRDVRFKINTEIYLPSKRHHIFKTIEIRREQVGMTSKLSEKIIILLKIVTQLPDKPLF